MSLTRTAKSPLIFFAASTHFNCVLFNFSPTVKWPAKIIVIIFLAIVISANVPHFAMFASGIIARRASTGKYARSDEVRGAEPQSACCVKLFGHNF